MTAPTTYTAEQVQALLSMQLATKQISATSPALIPQQGYGGLFNTPGVEPGVVSTIVQPVPGLAGYLEMAGHVRKSMMLDPVFQTVTGQRPDIGTEPDESCEGGPMGGEFKTCAQAWPFGRMTMQSKVVDISNAGALINRGVPLDQRWLNNPFAMLPEVAGLTAGNANEFFRNLMTYGTIQLLNSFNRRYRPLVFVGSPTNTTGNTGYQEYNGLDRIIRTGYQDIMSGIACPSLDSLIVDFGGDNIIDEPENYVNTLVEAVRYLTHLAEQVGIQDVQWAFVGRRGLFLKLTEIWPCVYMTYRCTTAAPNSDARVNVNAEASLRMIQEMRTGGYLLVDEGRIPFIIDDSPVETAAAPGVFESDLYLVPLRSPTFADTNGQITYFEYFDFNGPNAAADIIRRTGLREEFIISNDGRYLLHYMEPNHWCFQVEILTKKRLIVRTPFLAARFLNIQYTNRFHERSPYPDDPYFVNGGNYGLPGQVWPYGNWTS